jgi:hypothetical protein
MELYTNPEVAIELANVIFGIRDGNYDEPEKFEFKFVEKNTYQLFVDSYADKVDGNSKELLYCGVYRKTLEGTRLSVKRNLRANRLEMLVEYLGGLEEFVEGKLNWYIIFKDEEYQPACSSTWCEPEKVYMTQKVMNQVCELLNSGAYSLEGE